MLALIGNISTQLQKEYIIFQNGKSHVPLKYGNSTYFRENSIVLAKTGNVRTSQSVGNGYNQLEIVAKSSGSGTGARVHIGDNYYDIGFRDWYSTVLIDISDIESGKFGISKESRNSPMLYIKSIRLIE